MRVQTIKLEELKSPPKDADGHIGDSEHATTTEALKTPWGPYVQLELCNSAPEVDFVLRRRQMPSEVRDFIIIICEWISLLFYRTNGSARCEFRPNYVQRGISPPRTVVLTFSAVR